MSYGDIVYQITDALKRASIDTKHYHAIVSGLSVDIDIEDEKTSLQLIVSYLDNYLSFVDTTPQTRVLFRLTLSKLQNKKVLISFLENGYSKLLKPKADNVNKNEVKVGTYGDRIYTSDDHCLLIKLLSEALTSEGNKYINEIITIIDNISLSLHFNSTVYRTLNTMYHAIADLYNVPKHKEVMYLMSADNDIINEWVNALMLAIKEWVSKGFNVTVEEQHRPANWDYVNEPGLQPENGNNKPNVINEESINNYLHRLEKSLSKLHVTGKLSVKDFIIILRDYLNNRCLNKVTTSTAILMSIVKISRFLASENIHQQPVLLDALITTLENGLDEYFKLLDMLVEKHNNEKSK